MFQIENRRREVDYQVDYRLRAGHTLIAGFQSEREDIFTEDGNEPTLGAPSVSDLFGSPLILGNPDLEGETSTGYELGLERSFLAGALSFDATLFRLEIDDVIAVPGGLSQAVLPPENLDEARSEGVELTARWQIRPAIQVGFNYTSTDAVVKENGASCQCVSVPTTGPPLARSCARNPVACRAGSASPVSRSSI